MNVTKHNLWEVVVANDTYRVAAETLSKAVKVALEAAQHYSSHPSEVNVTSVTKLGIVSIAD